MSNQFTAATDPGLVGFLVLADEDEARLDGSEQLVRRILADRSWRRDSDVRDALFTAGFDARPVSNVKVRDGLL